jgi:2-isopropylmalate synthase
VAGRCGCPVSSSGKLEKSTITVQYALYYSEVFMQQITLYDTTLRDGTQGEEISYSVEDKLRIARRLDEFGIQYIEGGWPGSNPKDMEFFQKAKTLRLKQAKIAAFGSTRRAKNRVQDDPNITALLEAQTPVVTIFGKSWLLHVRSALNITGPENLEIIEDSVSYLKKQGREVIYDAEHFFDGFKDDKEYALESVKTAAKAGAEIIVLCDTNGGTMTNEIEAIVREVQKHVSAPIGIHTHNDCELAVANSIAAVRAGAVQVQGTINGFGERCGNANLCSVIPNLQLKLGYQCVTEKQIQLLTPLSHFVSESANLIHRKHLAFVGESAFAHKGGVHVSAVMRTPLTYEHIQPEVVGNRRRVLVSDLSGRSNVLYKAKELGIDLDQSSPEVQNIVDDVKAQEYNGYYYEDAEGSFELLVKRRLPGWKDFFILEGFKLIIHKESLDSQPVSEAIIKVRVGNEVEHTAADGNGPVNALDNALRKALEKFYPELKNISLSDYKVRVIDEKDGTRAKVRVLITTTDGHTAWNTVGASADIIEASWKAMIDSIYYYLLHPESVGNNVPEKGVNAVV